MPNNQQRWVLTLPDALRRKALAAGDVGRRWIADLDAILVEGTAAWELEIDGEFARSSQSLVLRVHLADGTRAVLKVGLPGIADLGREAHVCSLADGHVLPRVLAHHPGATHAPPLLPPSCLRAGLIVCVKMNHRILIGPLASGLVILLYELQSRTGAGRNEKGSRRAVPVK